MGCVSSKLFKKEIHRDILLNNGGECVNHVVSLTSTTYGALKLDNNHDPKNQPIKDIVAEPKKMQRSPPRDEPEVINAWELMGDLEDGVPISVVAKKSPKSLGILRGLADLDARSPLKFLNQFDSPKKAKRFGGKENKGCEIGVHKNVGESYFTPKSSSKKAKNSPANSGRAMLRLSFPFKGSPLGTRTGGFGNDSTVALRRRSLTPLFDPELVASYERELSQEEEQIKRIISPSPGIRKVKNTRDLESFLCQFEQKCPPGGENAVVMYTTTLRGIRKTFEDCNCVRSIIESHQIQLYERDISMDSGFKEELRTLMGTKEVKVPLVFVKGRLLGGVDQIIKLEEEGKLEILFEGIARAVAGGCEGCAGMRFVMCTDCNGSCKVLDNEQKKTLRCGECNENGLIHCPLCS
ncbi:hypothetical protein HS088_TW13G00324 [Tripterygium wilfordii]|uniref:Glutaredoxin domain-containing protein n=1 Tax=Tripterygium wilfordii TaxID=458696 RepID=A0A7J7CTM2_TRIWF|nr:uncharacterized protein LOC120013454 [Tripterygium wilfordii]KAF5737443.1 hypothetical protein HS088_TW13G00324 [Tripterygium wilfordii]